MYTQDPSLLSILTPLSYSIINEILQLEGAMIPATRVCFNHSTNGYAGLHFRPLFYRIHLRIVSYPPTYILPPPSCRPFQIHKDYVYTVKSALIIRLKGIDTDDVK